MTLRATNWWYEIEILWLAWISFLILKSTFRSDINSWQKAISENSVSEKNLEFSSIPNSMRHKCDCFHFAAKNLLNLFTMIKKSWQRKNVLKFLPLKKKYCVFSDLWKDSELCKLYWSDKKNAIFQILSWFNKPKQIKIITNHL